MRNIWYPAKFFYTVHNMTATIEDFKEAELKSSLGRHFHPSPLEINATLQMLGSSWSTAQPRAEMFLSVWLHKETTGNRKPSLTESPVTMGEGTEASVCVCVCMCERERERERVSLATGRKLLTSWLHSKTRLKVSAGYSHEARMRERERGKKKCSKADIKRNTPCLSSIYIEMSFPLSSACVWWIQRILMYVFCSFYCVWHFRASPLWLCVCLPLR